MKVGCLIVSALPLQAWLRAEPDLTGKALAIVEGEGVRTRVAEVSDAAQAGGARRGGLLSEAQVLVPTIAVKYRSEALESAAREAVIDSATAVSPRVEELEPGVVLVDGTGLGSVWGDDRAVASALLASAHQVGFTGRAAVAPGKWLARLAAERGEGLSAVREAEVAAFLAPLPFEALTQDAELLATLHRFGLRCAADFAAIPRDDVGTRLGQAGLALHRRTLGVDDEPLFPLAPPEQYREVVELEYSVEQIEPLLFLLRPAVERVLVRLGLRGKVVGGLTLRFQLDPRGEHPLPVVLAAPTRDVDDLVALCRQRIEANPPQAAIRGMVVVVVPAEIRVQQLGLWDVPTVAPYKMMGAIAQLAAICGPERVGRLAPVDSHRPDSARLRRFEPPPSASTLDEAKEAPRARLALRRFRPPVALTVTVSEAGTIERVKSRLATGRVASLAGPWRLDAEWYLAAVVLDTYDLSLASGGSYLIGRDKLKQLWWLFGKYD